MLQGQYTGQIKSPTIWGTPFMETRLFHTTCSNWDHVGLSRCQWLCAVLIKSPPIWTRRLFSPFPCGPRFWGCCTWHAMPGPFAGVWIKKKSWVVSYQVELISIKSLYDPSKHYHNGHVRFSYNLYFLACFFFQPEQCFLSQQISQNNVSPYFFSAKQTGPILNCLEC